MRRLIAEDPPEPTPLDDLPTDELGPPTFVTGNGTPLCLVTAQDVNAACDLPIGHDGPHMFNPELGTTYETAPAPAQRGDDLVVVDFGEITPLPPAVNDDTPKDQGDHDTGGQTR